MNKSLAIHWFRRDLRLKDNAALYHALRSGLKVVPVFIFDTNILNKLGNRKDLRVQFIHQRLKILKEELIELGSDLKVYHGEALDIWQEICSEFSPSHVFTNEDYEPYALERDKNVSAFLNQKGIAFKTFKDHVIFGPTEVLKDNGEPYTVFTPYSRKWKLKLNDFYLKPYPSLKYLHNLQSFSTPDFPDLERIGFESSDFNYPPENTEQGIIRQYHLKRDFPAIKGTSRLSLHFRFGTISIREKAAKALVLSEKWLNELIWRDFYIQIMAHFPYAMHSAFKPDYNRIQWVNDENLFQKWCEGKTGYPIVDAGMRELNTTGFMHNRVRMIVASFLCKHLLTDWRWGEAYFAEKLLDFELACNNGGWQWAASSGVDAAPYFRIFNPALQTQKFDPQETYIRQWVPEYGTPDYPAPIIAHEFARKRCLDVYKAGLKPS